MKRFNPKDNGVQLPWNDDQFIEKWSEWLQFRSERRLARYVPTGLKRTFSMLIRDSNNNVQTAIAMIDQSLEKGWQGIFPLKQQNNGQNNKGSFGEKSIPQTVNQRPFGQL